MRADPVDPRWPKLLSLTSHELRTPLTVVSGYVRMLLKDRAGPLAEQQRRLLEETERSCHRLSAILSEISDLAGLEAGTATFNRSSIELTSLLAEVVGGLPDLPDRQVDVDLQVSGEAVITGDASRLRGALKAVVLALRRELVTSDRLIVRQRLRAADHRSSHWIAIGDPDRIDGLSQAEPSALTTFDEWRGGSGLSLPIARRVITAHGGEIWSPVQETKAGAVIALPD